MMELKGLSNLIYIALTGLSIYNGLTLCIAVREI